MPLNLITYATSTTGLTTSYDASGNIIQTVVASEGAANNVAVSPLTNAATQPNVAPTGVSNVPLNALTVPVGNKQIGTSLGQSCASWSNPA
jgi:hypothetical protein